MKKPDILEAPEPVAEAFEKLGVLYYIVGSVASSAYGVPRSTMDVDMVSDLKPKHVRSFVRTLKSSFYIDKDMILDAIERCSSFNIVHLETMIKIDIFISKNTPYDIEAFKRRRKDTLDEEHSTTEFYLVSPEDIVLSKLVRFRYFERQCFWLIITRITWGNSWRFSVAWRDSCINRRDQLVEDRNHSRPVPSHCLFEEI